MGLRFRKSINLGPVRVNLSKSGVGYSVGVKGARVTKKATGGTRTTLSVPGTGISHVTETSAASQPKKEKKDVTAVSKKKGFPTAALVGVGVATLVGGMGYLGGSAQPPTDPVQLPPPTTSSSIVEEVTRQPLAPLPGGVEIADPEPVPEPVPEPEPVAPPPAPVVQPDPEPQPVVQPDPEPQAQNYIGNANSKVFHEPSCSSVDRMKDKNKVPLSSRDDAIARGFDPCERCSPK